MGMTCCEPQPLGQLLTGSDQIGCEEPLTLDTADQLTSPGLGYAPVCVFFYMTYFYIRHGFISNSRVAEL